MSGNAAGALTILLDSEGRYSDPSSLSGLEVPHHQVPSMEHVAGLLAQHYQLLPPGVQP